MKIVLELNACTVSDGGERDRKVGQKTRQREVKRKEGGRRESTEERKTNYIFTRNKGKIRNTTGGTKAKGPPVCV